MRFGISPVFAILIQNRSLWTLWVVDTHFLYTHLLKPLCHNLDSITRLIEPSQLFVSWVVVMTFSKERVHQEACILQGLDEVLFVRVSHGFCRKRADVAGVDYGDSLGVAIGMACSCMFGDVGDVLFHRWPERGGRA